MMDDSPTLPSSVHRVSDIEGEFTLLQSRAPDREQSRLVVVSNRVPQDAQSPGGLSVALKDAVTQREVLWFGWSGRISQTGTTDLSSRTQDNIEFVVTDLTQPEMDGYYAGYSNRTLWPAFHSRLDLSVFQDADLDAYRQVNSRFARTLFDHVEPDDVIWVHDYHLIPLAAELRALGVKNRIGFFSHIPFPPPEIFRAIPGHDYLTRGFAAYDLVGFQSSQDRANFERYICDGRSGFWRSDGSVCVDGRIVRPGSYPVGINAQEFEALAQSVDAAPAARELISRLGGGKLIIGVDRMDYTKGLVERVLAFEALLESAPDLAGKINFVQIAPVSRGVVDAYAELRTRLEAAVGRVNGRFARLDWTPIRFISQPVPREEIAPLMRLADIALVTPLKDGMNLVAKEFVAAQDDADPGVLVLSEFAGAAEQLRAALIVNPHDPHQQMRAIKEALAMSLEERQRRQRENREALERQDASWWSSTFLRDLAGSSASSISQAVAASLSARRTA